MGRRSLIGLILLILSLRGSGATLTVFGDSLSDTGTIETLLTGLGEPSQTPPPYLAGRFSNGPVYAEQLGFEVEPAVLGGTNFAVGGARTSSHVGGPLAAGLSLVGQVEFFRTLNSGQADPRDLYLLWIGGNDVREGVLSADAVEARSLIGAGLETVEMVLLDLREMGARNIIVPNLPDIGRIPQFVDDPVASLLGSELSDQWNEGLAEIVADLDDSRIQLFDANGLLNDLGDDPGRYGFTDTTGQALLNPDEDPDTFVFWDEIHPTARVHELLAAEMVALVPEPHWGMLGAFSCFVILCTRKRGRG